jgi:hypothetical protein
MLLGRLPATDWPRRRLLLLLLVRLLNPALLLPPCVADAAAASSDQRTLLALRAVLAGDAALLSMPLPVTRPASMSAASEAVKACWFVSTTVAWTEVLLQFVASGDRPSLTSQLLLLLLPGNFPVLAADGALPTDVIAVPCLGAAGGGVLGPAPELQKVVVVLLQLPTCAHTNTLRDGRWLQLL